jgi:hypothetical protein
MIQDRRDMGGEIQLKGNSFIERVQIIQKKDGETLWTLHAAKADFFEGEDKAELSDMSLKMQKNNIVLYTDRGIYSLSEKRFTTDQVVKAQAEDFLITADSMEFDISKRWSLIYLKALLRQVDGLSLRAKILKSKGRG